MAVRTSTKKAFFRLQGALVSSPTESFKRNCEHSCVKFPPPGWINQEKGEEDEGEREEGHGESEEMREEVRLV